MKKSGVFLAIFLAILLFTTSCDNSYTGNVVYDVNKEVASASTYYIEGTVLTLALTSEKECEAAGYSADTCPSSVYPYDKGRISIDKIISCKEYEGSTNSDGCSYLKEGTDIDVDFEYSTRPAKIVYKSSRRERAENSNRDIGGISLDTPVKRVDGYFIYESNDAQIRTEQATVLPGLKSGSRFRAELNNGKIRTYEAIP